MKIKVFSLNSRHTTASKLHSNAKTTSSFSTARLTRAFNAETQKVSFTQILLKKETKPNVRKISVNKACRDDEMSTKEIITRH